MVLDQLEPASHAYNLGYGLKIEGPLASGTLQRSVNAIVDRHEVLRTRFVSIDGSPLQQIDQTAEADWRLINLEALPADEREREAARLIEDETRRPFDLATGPLLRALVLRFDAENYLLLLTLHHIVSDAWSAGVLANELRELYRAFVAGEEPSCPTCPCNTLISLWWQHKRFADGARDRKSILETKWQTRPGAELHGFSAHCAPKLSRRKRDSPCAGGTRGRS